MDILQELQGLLGGRVKVTDTVPFPEERGSFSHGTEDYFPLGHGRWLVVDTESLAPETVGLLRLMLQKRNLHTEPEHAGWFARFIGDEWRNFEEVVSAVADSENNIDMPARLAMIECRGEGTVQVLELLQETLADSTAVAAAADKSGRYWLFLPESEGALADWKESASVWVDTLLTELYLDTRIGISGPASSVEQLFLARKEAEQALCAGSAYRHKQVVHAYEELGIAHILYGVTKEAKTAFLNEVLPSHQQAGLTQDLRETVLVFAKHGQNISETARALFIHRNTLLYRLEKIQETTGRDIRQFDDLLTLWMALILQSEQTVQ